MKASILGGAFALMTVVATVHATPAVPLPPEADPARQHFEAGRARVRAGRCDLAVDEFRLSIDVSPNVGAWLNLAECLETLGHLQDAWEALRSAQTLAAERHDDRLGVARASAERIESKVVRLTLSAPEQRDVSISVDGAEVPKARWSAVLVSPNEDHSVLAKTPDAPPFYRHVTGQGGEAITIAIAFEARTASEPPPPTRAPSKPYPLRTSGLIVAGVGAAAWIGAGVFGLLASAARRDLADAIARNHQCSGLYPNETCDASTRAELEPLHERTQGRAAAATVLFIGGAIALASGIGMIFFAPSPNEPKTARAFVPGFVW